MKIFNFKGKIKAYVREDTSDEFVVKEVFSGEYNKLNIKNTDVIVDFGLNIGMFTAYALTRGAKKVYSYEAEKENYTVAEQNMKLNEFDISRYVLNNKAVVATDQKQIVFWKNNSKNKGAHSLIHKKGRQSVVVDCVNVNDVLNEIKPNIVKMDIEGGEYDCLKAIKSYKGIREFIFEFHHTHLDDIGHVKYNEIINLMKENFDQVHYREEVKKAWVCVVYCKNND